ncbi:MAG: acyl--CoA ligase [Lachnospiraceae bacterium]|nr:acyl--CoA ligase [Lachnospiraceae bacterium]
MPITEYLFINAQKYGEEEAIAYIAPNSKRYYLTWSEFNDCSNKIANMLILKGIKQGDKIAILMPNCLYWLPIYFGILKLGAVVVPLNYNNNVEDIFYCIKHSDCKGIFLSDNDKCYSALEKSASSNFLVFQVNDAEFGRELSKYSACDIKITLLDKDIAAVYFSSGTTGKSKAVLLSHGALQAAAEIELAHHKQQHNDRFLCLTPLYHTGSKIHWFGSLIMGGALVIFTPTSPLRIIDMIEKEKISIVWLLVPQIQDVLDAIELGDVDINNGVLSSLRLMHSGAQPIPASLIWRWHNKFPHILYDTNYGLTESTGPGCIHLGVENIDKVGSIGKPDSHWLADIVDENGNSLGKDIVGELIIKGPSVMLEYYKDSNSTNKTLKNGWLYTGDMAYIDEDDFIYLVDRKKDVIISGGENIYPVQIENYLCSLECIKDVAVIGLPNKRMGEIVAAIIEVKEGYSCTKKDINDYCEELPEYQRPLRIYFAKVIRNATGKIDKKTMREKIVHTLI